MSCSFAITCSIYLHTSQDIKEPCQFFNHYFLGIEVLIAAAKMYQDNYPEIVKKVFFINGKHNREHFHKSSE